MKIAVAVLLTSLTSVRALQHPESPAQHCRHDAGPPWADDEENFGNKAYFDGTPAAPKGDCPAPLAAACSAKGKKAAFLDGPVDCGGKGWFCRILPQAGWRNPDFDDNNFAHCNARDADERDDQGHCHGSDVDSAYGWWVRDHWFRGYAGTLTCSCDWSKLEGLANRCDYRRHVDEDEAGKCRDANERHGMSYEDGCEAHADKPFDDPCDGPDSECWTVTSFADPESIGDGGDESEGDEQEDEDAGDEEEDEDAGDESEGDESEGDEQEGDEEEDSEEGDEDSGDEDERDEEEDEDSGDEDAGDEEEDSYEDDGDECEDDPRWRKHPRKNRRKRHDCDWVAAKARKRCKKKNKIGVRASEACECACA